MLKFILTRLWLSLALIVALGAVAEAKTASFNRSNVEASDSAFVSIEADEVEANEDLRLYALGVINSDESIEEIQFSENAVEVSYKQKGYLLALVPVTFTVRAIAKADGTVELKYPWYSVITVDNKTQMETELKIAVNTTVSQGLVGSVRADGKSDNPTFSASELAQVASVMQKVLRSRIKTHETVD